MRANPLTDDASLAPGGVLQGQARLGQEGRPEGAGQGRQSCPHGIAKRITGGDRSARVRGFGVTANYGLLDAPERIQWAIVAFVVAVWPSSDRRRI